jgi:hypothetical protein
LESKTLNTQELGDEFVKADSILYLGPELARESIHFFEQEPTKQNTLWPKKST